MKNSAAIADTVESDTSISTCADCQNTRCGCWFVIEGVAVFICDTCIDEMSKEYLLHVVNQYAGE